MHSISIKRDMINYKVYYLKKIVNIKINNNSLNNQKISYRNKNKKEQIFNNKLLI